MTPRPSHPPRRLSSHGPSGKNASPEISRTYAAWLRIQRLRRRGAPDIAPRWFRCFDNFLEDVGSRPKGCQPSRPRPDLPYGPDNFAWVARRGGGRVPEVIAHAGEARTIREWAAHAGVKEITLRDRLKRGLSFDLAIQPTDYRRSAR